jgi:GTP-binding protein
VVIGPKDGVVFDWEPTLTSTAELVASPRGTDDRIGERSRATRAERREHYFERMDAKAEARDELLRERDAGLWTDDEGFEVQRDGRNAAGDSSDGDDE